MKIKGIFYLSSGAIHTEVIRVKKDKKNETINWINEFIKEFEAGKLDNSYVRFGYFHCRSENITAIRIK